MRAQFGGLCFELFDGEPFDQRGIVEEAVFIAGEEIAGDAAAGGLVGGGGAEGAEVGIERHGALGQPALHGVGLNVGIVLELVPHGQLRRVIGAESESRHGFEADFTCAVSVEQFRRELAEAQALPHMAFGNAETNRNRLDRLAGVDQGRHRHKFVGRMHRRADGVFH